MLRFLTTSITVPIINCACSPKHTSTRIHPHVHPKSSQTSHHEAHAAAHIRHIKDELLRRIQAAFADQASLFDGEGELGPMPSAATQPPYQANSAAASPPGSQQRGHPAACTPPTSRHPSASQSHATPGADDASLFDNLPPLDEVATPGPLLSGPRSAAHAAASTSIPTNGHPGHPSVQPPPHGNGRANGTAFVSPGQGASVELAQHGAAPSDTGGSMDMEIDILAPSPPGMCVVGGVGVHCIWEYVCT